MLSPPHCQPVPDVRGLVPEDFWHNQALQILMGIRAQISLLIGSTMLQILMITLMPTATGVALRHRWPALALRLERQVSRLAARLPRLIILLLLIREGASYRRSSGKWFWLWCSSTGLWMDVTTGQDVVRLGPWKALR